MIVLLVIIFALAGFVIYQYGQIRELERQRKPNKSVFLVVDDMWDGCELYSIWSTEQEAELNCPSDCHVENRIAR